LSEIEFEEPILSSLIGFHALTGNVFVSSFLERERKKVSEYLKKNSKFKKH